MLVNFLGNFVFPGGHPEPQEVGIETHKFSKDSKDSELVNEKVSQEMFESIIREVVEEVGVPTTSLVSEDHFIDVPGSEVNVGYENVYCTGNLIAGPDCIPDN
ncbi:hypothetical protein F3Y22_tig00110556pilonHSYRG00863 [Hibiscus syriacus]|uniref:Nudix hydrolase domain-containing protein n=1 Tax=Hibiscus syriacus TaxID=106335 RepID=A0A6A3A8S4_HIBSY|nr:hypothetical protein F3Y22_tig00110556pilonHSYRG00863 [Hibiscus syriacus]